MICDAITRRIWRENWAKSAKSKNGFLVSVYNSGRGIISQTLLYQHMSNHYRRILNAKKAVDTAPPPTFKPKRNATSSASTSPVRSFTATNKNYNVRNVSPALTERTVSTCSNGGSYWGAESYYGRKCQISGNNRCRCRTRSEINQNTSDMELITQIAFDTKCGPANCFETDWKTNESRGNLNQLRSPYETKKNLTRNSTSGIVKKTCVNKNKLSAVKRKLSQKDRASSDLMEKHSKCFIPHNNSFRPRILKTNATSKVRTLKVYHPPKKKNGIRRREVDKEETKGSMEQVNNVKSKSGVVSATNQNRKCATCKCNKSANPRETSQTSSRDSAYNGGVSSLPESRSPTPDQKKQGNCCCRRKVLDTYYDDENIIIPNLKLTDNQNTQTELIQIPESKNIKNEIPDCCRSKTFDYKAEKCSTSKNSFNAEDRDYFKKKVKEEALYTNFIRDITAEVLDKGLFTNKALKKVMKRHLLSNLWILDKNRMMKEIDKLRVQLGIPEDEDLMNINVGSTGSAAVVDENFPVVSDSDPVSIKTNKSSNFRRRDSYGSIHAEGSDNEKSFPKSISDVLYQTDNHELILDTDSDDEDEELISVIHVTKLVKDKKRNDPHVRDLSSDASGNCTRGNSADESDQSRSDRANRKKKVHPRFRKTEKSSSSSDDHALTKTAAADNRKHSRGMFDSPKDPTILGSPQRRGTTTSSKRDKEKEVDKSGE